MLARYLRDTCEMLAIYLASPFQVLGFRFQVSGFRFQVSSFRFQVSGLASLTLLWLGIESKLSLLSLCATFRFQVSSFRFQVSRLTSSSSLFAIVYFSSSVLTHFICFASAVLFAVVHFNANVLMASGSRPTVHDLWFAPRQLMRALLRSVWRRFGFHVLFSIKNERIGELSSRFPVYFRLIYTFRQPFCRRQHAGKVLGGVLAKLECCHSHRLCIVADGHLYYHSVELPT